MNAFFAGVKRWWLRRFRGYVAAPPRSGGTSWQQWPNWRTTFLCKCSYQGDFSPDTYVIRSQDHVDGCQFLPLGGKSTCDCPVTDARYVKICPQCGLGHWRQAWIVTSTSV